jgi:predicted ATPase
MITHFHIENFKSLASFDLPDGEHELAPFTCLIGLNGSGKTTLLQAFSFLGHLAAGTVRQWLQERDWKAMELMSRNLEGRRRMIPFRATFRFGERRLSWEGAFNIVTQRCSHEAVRSDDVPLLLLDGSELQLANGERELQPRQQLLFEFEGSVLSALRVSRSHEELVGLKTFLQRLKSLELLSPHLLRKRARGAEDIGTGGEKLSGFLSTLPHDARLKLGEDLARFYPSAEYLGVHRFRGGWKEVRVYEDGIDGWVRAGHLNDGLLRVIAILAQAYSGHSFLLFDEIENGINPEIVGQLVDALIALSKKGKQVVVTTHSPMILNYLEDKIAKESVVLLYKDRRSGTRAVRFFDLPAPREKLHALGPGEVFVDTDLTKLSAQLAEKETEAPPRA